MTTQTRLYAVRPPCQGRRQEPDGRNTLKKKLFLLSELVRRDLLSRYAGSFAGAWWALAHPVILGALYGVVFGSILKISPPTGFPGGFLEFLLGGLLPWIGFQEAVTRGAGAVVDQAHLVKKLAFPVELLVLSAIGAALALQVVSVGVLVGWTVVGRGLTPNLPALAGAFAFELLLLFGVVLALSALTVFFRDVTQILGPVLMVVFYLTPIIYPASMIPPSMASIAVANPVAAMVALFRAGLFGTPFPSPTLLACWGALLTVVAFAGLRFFRRCRPGFADLL